MVAESRLGIGGNNPPTDEELMAEKLKSDHLEILAFYESVVNKAPEMPDKVEDDEAAGKVSDFIKKITSCKKTLDSARSAEKEPYLAKGRAIDSFFKRRTETLDDLKKKIEVPLGEYLKRKEDEKRRAAEEKARAEREEAARKLAEAQEKERQAREAAEAAEREKERIKRESDEAAEKSRREAEEAKARAEAEAARIRKEAAEAAEAAKLEAERVAKEAEERRNREVLQAQESEAEERKRREEAESRAKAAEKAQKEAEREARRIQEEADKAARESEREARRIEREAEENAKAADREAKETSREANRALDVAVRADKLATKAEKATHEKGSILSRTRGDGSLSSVTETWVGSIISRDELDLESIREHIPFAALEQAVQSFVNAGGRELRGAIITEETKTVVR